MAQAQKSADPLDRQAIGEANTPGRAKRLAAPPDGPRKVSGQSWFRRSKTLPRPDWGEVKLTKLEILRRADRVKFKQNPELAQMLLDTGEAKLI
jgi:predicted NAD-dependent protein-ADP-ribosyltransferase YbiA (DUF1768 family)